MALRISTLLAVVLVLSIGFIGVEMMSGGERLGFIEPSSQSRIDAAAMRLNAGAPIEYENGARFDRVDSLPGGIRFNFTILHLSIGEIDRSEFHSLVSAGSREQICRNPLLVDLMMNSEIFVESVFNSNDGEKITTFRIDLGDCTGGV